jgi:tetratricopeptide (TPR) repeat protein
VKKAGLGLDREEHARRVTQIREAEAALAADDFAKAWNLLESVKREVERGALCAQAATAAEAVAKRVEELLDQADAQVGAGEITAAYDTYSQVEAVFRKTELGKRAQKEKGRLERGKETGEIIRAHKIAIEAEELLRKAEALEGQGDPARALRIYEQILERFADTPAAQNARIRAKALRGGTGS